VHDPWAEVNKTPEEVLASAGLKEVLEHHVVAG